MKKRYRYLQLSVALCLLAWILFALSSCATSIPAYRIPPDKTSSLNLGLSLIFGSETLAYMPSLGFKSRLSPQDELWFDFHPLVLTTEGKRLNDDANPIFHWGWTRYFVANSIDGGSLSISNPWYMLNKIPVPDLELRLGGCVRTEPMLLYGSFGTGIARWVGLSGQMIPFFLDCGIGLQGEWGGGIFLLQLSSMPHLSLSGFLIPW